MPFEMMISGVHHVAVISSDYEKSRRFYSEMLGFRIISGTYRPERYSYKLDLALPGGMQIELCSFPDAPQRPSYPEACELRLLAFAVPNLDGAIAALLAQGIRVEEARVDELTGRRFTFFADPDGLPLELYEEVGL